MRIRTCLVVFVLCAVAGGPAAAVEGSSAAGPTGGNDIRSANLPPPGLYGGNILFGAVAHDFVDGDGKTIPALSEARLTRTRTAPFLVYVPDVEVFGGSVGIAAVLPMGEDCGHLFANSPSDCFSGDGDLYVEAAWSRSFGTLRPSEYSGALPILEGLTVLVGLGVVFPTGRYDAEVATTQGLTVGNNIRDVAPAVALTFTTPPILAEGTEVSAKLYWNNYLTNPETRYLTGDLISVDFAVTERIGRFQLGLAGTYAVQVEDDELLGVRIPPDGRRGEVLSLGGVVNLDLPEYNAALRVKALSTVHTENTVESYGVVFGWFKKF